MSTPYNHPATLILSTERCLSHRCPRHLSSLFSDILPTIFSTSENRCDSHLCMRCDSHHPYRCDSHQFPYHTSNMPQTILHPSLQHSTRIERQMILYNIIYIIYRTLDCMSIKKRTRPIDRCIDDKNAKIIWYINIQNVPLVSFFTSLHHFFFHTFSLFNFFFVSLHPELFSKRDRTIC